MQTRRGTVLGKRGHHELSSTTAAKTTACEQLHTPESSPDPKRCRTSLSLEDDGSNKENIPPLKDCLISNEASTPRRVRASRRDDVTPTRIGIQRSASTSSVPLSTPSMAIQSLHLVTPPPTPPTHLVPLHSRIRALLRSTCNNTQTPVTGRESERATILNFINSFIDATSDDVKLSMFISGSPGTGKTALVNSLVSQFAIKHPSDVKVIFINCMALQSVDALWERLVDEFDINDSRKRSAGKKIKTKGREAVQALFQTSNLKCILILDELDHITPDEQSLSSIFTLTQSLSTLRLIGIANTHTLTATSSNPLLGTMNVQTVHFAPYNPLQLQEILHSRLSSLSADEPSKFANEIKSLLPNPAIVLLTKKVAALTGDVRCLFEVLRGAIDIAALTNASSGENPLYKPSPTVTPQHILSAFKSYTPASSNSNSNSPFGKSIASNNEVLTKVRNIGLQARLVLLSIIIASKRLSSGLTLSQATSSSPKKIRPSPMKRSFSMPNYTPTQFIGIDTGSLNTFYSLVLSRTENQIFETVSRSEFGDLLGVLEVAGLVSLTSSGGTGTPRAKKTFGRSMSKNGAGSMGEVRLVDGIWGEEVLRCLGAINVDNIASSDPREEEVRGIWEREKSRLSRDLKAASRSMDVDIDILSGAFQR